eukprot:m.213855 g.213855  ORF g.213855 m.213855 type:complete len:131 (+) comp54047_c0_seq2:307-699(+)
MPLTYQTLGFLAQLSKSRCCFHLRQLKIDCSQRNPGSLKLCLSCLERVLDLSQQSLRHQSLVFLLNEGFVLLIQLGLEDRFFSLMLCKLRLMVSFKPVCPLLCLLMEDSDHSVFLFTEHSPRTWRLDCST